MDFLGIALRYLAFALPAFAVYVAVLRRTGANPTLVANVWTAANLLVGGYLVWWGLGAGLGWTRAVLYTLAAIIVILIPLVTFVALFARGDRDSG